LRALPIDINNPETFEHMTLLSIFFNDVGRLRSGWRLTVFLSLFLILFAILSRTIYLLAAIYAGSADLRFIGQIWANGGSQVALFLSAVIAGWLCGRILEGLPFKATGWAPHDGWIRDFFVGSAVGTLALVLTVVLAAFGGGLKFELNGAEASSIFRTLVVSLLAYVLFAAAEEALFRGYPLQTFARAHLAWVSILLTSAIFARAHLDNPNVVPGFTFLNTTLAGIWLAVAYLKTRSMWFPLGLHWSWNWAMGSALGLPVSGISRISPSPLLRGYDMGPAWLTGGSYGIEGGAACTIILTIATIWIWKTTFLRASEEMLRLSDHERAEGGGLKVVNAHSLVTHD
jgi:hypothetical protein